MPLHGQNGLQSNPLLVCNRLLQSLPRTMTAFFAVCIRIYENNQISLMMQQQRYRGSRPIFRPERTRTDRAKRSVEWQLT